MNAGRVLILDDDPTVAQILTMSARVAGHEARSHGHVAGFMADVSSWQPTHVILDLNLPDTTAADVLQVLARQGCEARVVVCSGASAPEMAAALDLARSLGLRASGVLSKPFTQAEFRAVISVPD
jgi:DNA-binding response OmpR family regulator